MQGLSPGSYQVFQRQGPTAVQDQVMRVHKLLSGQAARGHQQDCRYLDPTLAVASLQPPIGHFPAGEAGPLSSSSSQAESAH